MAKCHFMFFDSSLTPLAVFYTETVDEAIYLFTKLYQTTWDELSNVHKVTVMKEEEVTPEGWEVICGKSVKQGLPEIKREVDTDYLAKQDFVVKYLRPK